mgnify:CR=1 FL=1
MAVVAMSAFFLSLDLTFVNVALPEIGTDLGASLTGLGWVVDAYTLALTGLLLPGAALAERHGRRRVFLVGMAIFTVTSALAGLAPDMGTMIGARAGMGIGGGLMLAPAIALTAMLFPFGQRARALATWASASAIGLAAGPVLGGLVVGLIGWRWTFLLTVPFLVVSLVLGMRVLPEGGSATDRPLDLVGVALSMLGLVPLVAALLDGPRSGWGLRTAGGLVLGIALITWFVVRMLRARHPIFDPRVLARPSVRGTSIALFASYVVLMGGIFLATIEMQAVLGVGPVQYGLLLTPLAIMYWLMSRVGAVLATRGASTWAIVVGLAVSLASFVVEGLLPSSAATSTLALALMGTAGGLISPTSVARMLDDLDDMDGLGTASGLSVLSRFIGGTIGVAIIAPVAEAAPTAEDGIVRGSIAGAVVVLVLAALALPPLLRRHGGKGRIGGGHVAGGHAPQG